MITSTRRAAQRVRLLSSAMMIAAVAGLASASAQAEDRACMVPHKTMEDGSTALDMSKGALESAYDCFAPQLLAGYAQSKHILARKFGDWERASDAPFMYDPVGNRYLAVYGNERAIGEEETLWLDRNLPVGAIVAAAGFTVDDTGKLAAAPLLIYEKMNKGYDFGRGNWRQTLIAEDGQIMGVTKGPGAEALTLCKDCGARAADRVYLAMLNDGVVPADAPEAGPPITDNELGGADTGGDVLAPPQSELPMAPLAPLDPLAPSPDAPASQSLDPNATLAPLDPNAPLDPLAPLTPAPTLDPNAPLDPLAPDQTSALPSADESSDTAMVDPSLSSPSGTAAEALAPDTSSDPDVAKPGDIVETPLNGLAMELDEARDPLLSVPNFDAATPPPALEPALGS